jgi:cobalamin biosynthesis protein CbiG
MAVIRAVDVGSDIAPLADGLAGGPSEVPCELTDPLLPQLAITTAAQAVAQTAAALARVRMSR